MFAGCQLDTSMPCMSAIAVGVTVSMASSVTSIASSRCLNRVVDMRLSLSYE